MATSHVWRGAAAVMARGAVACSVCISATVACTRGPIELGFWIEPVSYASPRLGDPISGTELAAIEAMARAEIATAFERFDVVVSDNRQARYHVRVVQQLREERFRRREANVAGASRGVTGFGGSGAVNFEFLANGAMVFSPESGQPRRGDRGARPRHRPGGDSRVPSPAPAKGADPRQS